MQTETGFLEEDLDTHFCHLLLSFCNVIFKSEEKFMICILAGYKKGAIMKNPLFFVLLFSFCFMNVIDDKIDSSQFLELASFCWFLVFLFGFRGTLCQLKNDNLI